MPEASLADLYAGALAAAGPTGPAAILPSGNYEAKLVGKKLGTATGGKPQYGLRWEILDGPHAGQTTWTNQTLTIDNQQALGIYLSQLIQLGVDEAFIRSGQVQPDQLPNYVVKGITGTLTLGQHPWGTDPATGAPKLHQDFKGFVLKSIPQSAVSPTGAPVIPSNAVPVQPAIPTPQMPQAAPVSVQPVVAPVAAPAPVQQVYVPAPPTVTPPAITVAVPPLPQAPVVPAAPLGTTVTF